MGFGDPPSSLKPSRIETFPKSTQTDDGRQVRRRALQSALRREIGGGDGGIGGTLQSSVAWAFKKMVEPGE